MQTRNLGWTDVNLTNIGLGTWAIGGSGWKFSWGSQNDKDSISTIRNALKNGINWIDTAPAYGLGHSEDIVGKAIKEINDKPIISTKCGAVWGTDRTISYCLKKKSIRSEVEASLKRLSISVIDLYQIHLPKPDEYIEEAWSTIVDLIKEGKVRYAGVSNFNIEQLKRVQAIHHVAFIQSPYSMIERGIETGIMDYCSTNNIGVIVYSPMQKGILTGKFTKERVQNMPDDDHRRRDSHFLEPELGANLELVEGLCLIAKKSGKTVAQLAIAWVLSSRITGAIVGARHPSQIEEIIGTSELILSKEDIASIDLLLTKRQKALTKC